MIAKFISALHELDVPSNGPWKGLETTFAAAANVHLLLTLRTRSIRAIQNTFLDLRFLHL
ncbi:MAG: hypothetical protein O3C40_00480 [Planctomycetota bacterium]|nr:hypothetical protein [Planctomycetota bacterium]